MARFKAIIAFFFALAVMGASTAVYAADNNECAIDDGLAALHAIQEHPDSSFIGAELSARKNILSTIIGCATKETDTLKNSVVTIHEKDQTAKNIQGQFVSKFGEVFDYYDLQKSRIGDLGLEGTKEFSRNLKEWRTVAYAPLSQQAANFIIWTKNQAILENAGNRFGQISRTLDLLKLSDNPPIQELLQKADTNLHVATDANQRAEDALARFDSPENSSALIRDTLNSLASVYQAFFDIAEALGKK